MNNLVLKESVIVGGIFLIITSIIMAMMHDIYPNDYAGCLHLPNKSIGKYYIATFISGVLVHLLCEYFGINKFYCLNGNACVK
jgi:hypothetical protein